VNADFLCAAAIRRVGRAVTRLREGEAPAVFSGSLQPRGGPEEEAVTVGGRISRSRYLLLAPAGADLAPGDALDCAGGRYLVTAVEPVLFGERTAYQRASLRPERGQP